MTIASDDIEIVRTAPCSPRDVATRTIAAKAYGTIAKGVKARRITHRRLSPGDSLAIVTASVGMTNNATTTPAATLMTGTYDLTVARSVPPATQGDLRVPQGHDLSP